MADVEAKFFVYKCTEHKPKCGYWPMLKNIISKCWAPGDKKLNNLALDNGFKLLVRGPSQYKDVILPYRDPHIKDKMVLWPPYF